MSALSRFLPAVPPAPPLVLVRGDVFFVRRVALLAGEPAGPQVALALEGMAPFPPEQLYFGHVAAPDGGSALVFAMFRRRFAADDTADWDGARLVAPEFLALLGARPGDGAGAVLHVGAERVTALAWEAGQELPAAVMCREGGPETAEAFWVDFSARANLSQSVRRERLDGELSLVQTGDGAVAARVGAAEAGVLAGAWAETADVRDPDFLTARRIEGVRSLWLWRGVLGAVALLVLSATLDIGGLVLGVMAGKRVAQVKSQEEAVHQTETAQTLANRIAELSEKRLMPFEMLLILNPARPDSVVFQRAVTRGLLKLEVEAQAANAEDVGRFSNALKANAGIASAVTRDVRARDGVTSFVLDVEFKSEALKNGGAL